MSHFLNSSQKLGVIIQAHRPLFACMISAQMVELSIADTAAAADWIRCGRWESSLARKGWPDYPEVVTVIISWISMPLIILIVMPRRDSRLTCGDGIFASMYVVYTAELVFNSPSRRNAWL